MSTPLEIDVLTIFPESVRVPLSESIMGRASDNGYIQIRVHDLRDWTTDSYRKVDDEPYGGGPGMVMMDEPLFRAIDFVIEKFCGDDGMRVLYPSPQGIAWSQDSAEENKSVEKRNFWCGKIEYFKKLFPGCREIEFFKKSFPGCREFKFVKKAFSWFGEIEFFRKAFPGCEEIK